MQSRVVNGFLTKQNALRKYLCITGLTVGGVGLRKKPQLMLCRSEALATLTHTNLDSFFLDPENVRNLYLGVIWNFIKGTDSNKLEFS